MDPRCDPKHWVEDASCWKRQCFPNGENILVSVDWSKSDSPDYCMGPYRLQRGDTCCPVACISTAESAIKKVDPAGFAPLSLQQLLDKCVPQDTYRILSRLPPYMASMGLHKEEDYPDAPGRFDPKNRGECKMATLKQRKLYFLKSFNTFSNLKVSQIIKELVKGPIVAKIYIDEDMGSYSGDVISYTKSWGTPNHCCQLVGFNFDAPESYFIGLCNYGIRFGNDGKILVSMFKNTLGLQTRVAVPVYDIQFDQEKNNMQGRSSV